MTGLHKETILVPSKAKALTEEIPPAPFVFSGILPHGENRGLPVQKNDPETPVGVSGSLIIFTVYRLRVRISAVTLAMKSSRLISVVSPLRSRTEMLPASASLAPSTSI